MARPGAAGGSLRARLGRQRQRLPRPAGARRDRGDARRGASGYDSPDQPAPVGRRAAVQRAGATGAGQLGPAAGERIDGAGGWRRRGPAAGLGVRGGSRPPRSRARQPLRAAARRADAGLPRRRGVARLRPPARCRADREPRLRRASPATTGSTTPRCCSSPAPRPAAVAAGAARALRRRAHHHRAAGRDPRDQPARSSIAPS